MSGNRPQYSSPVPPRAKFGPFMTNAEPMPTRREPKEARAITKTQDETNSYGSYGSSQRSSYQQRQTGSPAYDNNYCVDGQLGQYWRNIPSPSPLLEDVKYNNKSNLKRKADPGESTMYNYQSNVLSPGPISYLANTPPPTPTMMSTPPSSSYFSNYLPSSSNYLQSNNSNYIQQTMPNYLQGSSSNYGQSPSNYHTFPTSNYQEQSSNMNYLQTGNSFQDYYSLDNKSSVPVTTTFSVPESNPWPVPQNTPMFHDPRNQPQPQGFYSMPRYVPNYNNNFPGVYGPPMMNAFPPQYYTYYNAPPPPPHPSFVPVPMPYEGEQQPMHYRGVTYYNPCPVYLPTSAPTVPVPPQSSVTIGITHYPTNVNNSTEEASFASSPESLVEKQKNDKTIVLPQNVMKKYGDKKQVKTSPVAEDNKSQTKTPVKRSSASPLKIPVKKNTTTSVEVTVKKTIVSPVQAKKATVTPADVPVKIESPVDVQPEKELPVDEQINKTDVMPVEVPVKNIDPVPVRRSKDANSITKNNKDANTIKKNKNTKKDQDNINKSLQSINLNEDSNSNFHDDIKMNDNPNFICGDSKNSSLNCQINQFKYERKANFGGKPTYTPRKNGRHGQSKDKRDDNRTFNRNQNPSNYSWRFNNDQRNDAEPTNISPVRPASGDSGYNSFNFSESLKKADKEREAALAKLPPIIKDTYKEHPRIASMSEVLAEAIRIEKSETSVKYVEPHELSSISSSTVVAETKPRIPIPKPVLSFHDCFHEYPELLEQLKLQDFQEPTPIQCSLWPCIMKGLDVVGIAQTGSGKTLAYLLPAFVHIQAQQTPREERKSPTVLVLAPTRELAQQIDKEVKKYNFQDIRSVCVYGGGSRFEQIEALHLQTEIVIATPGRLNDLVQSEKLKLHEVSYLVLDEADEMLAQGFEPQINRALLNVRGDRQTILTSATWPESVRRMAKNYTDTPVLVTVGTLNVSAVKSVHQTFIFLEEDKRQDKILEMCLSMKPTDKMIVFVNMKSMADHMSSELTLKNVNVQTIHGTLCQEEREQAVEDMRTGKARILIATDVVARGIDIQDVTHVVNYALPKCMEQYVHRIGRTGRAGKTGESITFIGRPDWARAKELIEVLERAEQPIPRDLIDMADRFAKRPNKDQGFGYNRGGNRGGGGRNRFSNDYGGSGGGGYGNFNRRGKW